MQRVVEALQQLLRTTVASLEPSFPVETVRWDVPNDASFGDLSCPVAFKLASRQKAPPPAIAERLAAALREAVKGSFVQPFVQQLDVKSGFVNLVLSQQALHEVLTSVLE